MTENALIKFDPAALEKAVAKNVSNKFRHVAGKDLVLAQEKAFLMQIVGGSKSLQDATIDSLAMALIQSGTMGLSLNPGLQHCYLIPRHARKKQQGESWADYNANVPMIAYASPSYRGLAHLATAAGFIKWVRAEVVFKADFFEYHGPAEKPKHTPILDQKKRNEADAIGAYALAKTADGDFLCEYIDRESIQRIRAKSEQPDSLMWNPKFLWSEGWKKAAIRRLFKTLPQCAPAMQTALSHLDNYEGVTIEGESEHVKDSRETITEDQSLTLHAKLTDHGIRDDALERWLARLSKRFGVGVIDDIPADQFENAVAILDDALANKAGE